MKQVFRIRISGIWSERKTFWIFFSENFIDVRWRAISQRQRKKMSSCEDKEGSCSASCKSAAAARFLSPALEVCSFVCAASRFYRFNRFSAFFQPKVLRPLPSYEHWVSDWNSSQILNNFMSFHCPWISLQFCFWVQNFQTKRLAVKS